MTEPAKIWEATFDERIKPYTMWLTQLSDICDTLNRIESRLDRRD